MTVYGLDIAKNEVQQLWRLPASQTGAMLAPVPLSDNSSNSKCRFTSAAAEMSTSQPYCVRISLVGPCVDV